MTKLFSCVVLAAMFFVTQAQAQTVEYIHTDALGSPVAVTDANGNVIERFEYAPYGEVLNQPATDGPGYTGHVLDSATGLNYMQQRYYDPMLGRTLSVDPVTPYDSGDWRHFNVYAYAYNNPYKFTDPDGRQAAERFVEQHRSDMEAGNGKIYEPFQPAAIAVTGAMLTLTPFAGPELAFGLRAVTRNSEQSTAGQGATATGAKSSSEIKTVGRYMSPAELQKMRTTGRVQEGGGGQTRVADPANPGTYRNAPEGDVYVEFDVPAGRVLPHSTGTGRIPGPNSPDARVPGRNPNDFEMPNADRIREIP